MLDTASGDPNAAACDPSATTTTSSTVPCTAQGKAGAKAKAPAQGESKDARMTRYKRGYADATKGVEPATEEAYYMKGYDDAMNHKQVVGDTGSTSATAVKFSSTGRNARLDTFMSGKEKKDAASRDKAKKDASAKKDSKPKKESHAKKDMAATTDVSATGLTVPGDTRRRH